MTQFKRIASWFENVTVVVCSNADTLSKSKPEVTIEAEYGARCVEGTKLTLAHHGPRSENPAPCVTKVPKGLGRELAKTKATIGISHLDLDTLGGILRLAEQDGPQVGGDEFWRVAAFVDVKGPHRLLEANTDEETTRQLHAFWAWSEKNRCRPSPEVDDVTANVKKAATVLMEIFGLSSEDLQTYWLDAGDRLRDAEEKLNKSSFCESTLSGTAILRISDRFVNHLYTAPNGETADVVLAYNTVTGAITVSRENEQVDFHAAEFLQELFGPEAGGHPGIAGSPRGKRMLLSDLTLTWQTLAVRLLH